MSTASPDTCADVLGVATHRAASASEPYSETASRSSCSWYSGERQPLSTKSSTPSYAASVAARRRAPRRAGSRLATPAIPSAKTVVPSGTALSRSPGAPRCSRRRTSIGNAAVEDEDGSNCWPRATAIAAMTTSRPAARSLRIRIRRVVRRAGRREATPAFKAAWCCRPVWGFRYADDTRQHLASEDAGLDRRG